MDENQVDAPKTSEETQVKILWLSRSDSFQNYNAKLGTYTKETGDYLISRFKALAEARNRFLQAKVGTLGIGGIENQMIRLGEAAVTRPDRQNIFLLLLPRTTLETEVEEYRRIFAGIISIERMPLFSAENAVVHLLFWRPQQNCLGE